MGIYDDPEDLPVEKEEKPVSKKTKTKKTSSSGVSKKKTSVKKKTRKKRTVVKKEESVEEKLSKIKRKDNEDSWDFIIRASIETGLPGKTVANYFEKLKTEKKEVKKHLDAGREVYAKQDGRPGKTIPEPDSTNTRWEYTDEPKLTAEEFLNSVKPQPEYVKHLVKCRCILPQFQKMEEPPDHQFIVFSELKEDGSIKPHYAQCNNCNLIHKIHEVGLSETLKKETMLSLPTIEDFKNTLPEWAVNFLSQSDCELHTWQEADFIIKHKLWGRFIILAKDRDEQVCVKKVCQILGDNFYKIENVEEEEGWIEP